MKKRILVWLAVLLTACVVLGLSLSQRPTVRALEPTPSSFPVGVWRRCVLLAGQGQVLAIAVSPNYAADGTVFIATSLGGVWRSTDFGESWQQASSGLPSWRMNDLVISPNFASDQTLFAVTSESQGVYKSQNGGASWASAKGDLPALTPTALAMVADEVFVGTQLSSGKAYLYTTRDGGATWGKYLELGRGGNITDITLPPEFPLDRTNIWVTSELAVLKRKADNTTWVVQYQVGGMFGREWIPKVLAASPDDLFVGVYRGVLNGDSCVNRSTDGGQHWLRSLTFASEEITYGLVASPNYASDHTVFLGLDWERYLGWSSIQGVRASTDSGATWQAIDQGLLDLTIRSLGVAIKGGDFHLFAGTSQGLYRRVPPTTDVRIDAGDVHLIQVVEDVNLVKDKGTAIKVTVKKTGPDPAPGVRLQLKVNGQLLNLPFYHEESATRESDFVLQNPVTGIYFDAGDQQKTVYFFGDELTPRTEGQYTVEVTAVPHEDRDLGNNTATTSQTVVQTKWGSNDPEELRIAYLVGDWPASKIISPISGAEVGTQLELIHRSQEYLGANFPMPDSSLKFNLVLDEASSEGFDLDGDSRLNGSELRSLAERVWDETREMSPDSDRVACLVPPGWICRKVKLNHPCGFGDVAYGVTISWEKDGVHEAVPVIFVEAKDVSSQLLTPYTTAAHEIGHTYLLGDIGECGVSQGFWVDKRQLFLNGLNQHAVHNLMASGRFSCSGDAWIGRQNYIELLERVGVNAGGLRESAAVLESKVIQVRGTVRRDGSVDLEPFVVFAEGETRLESMGGEYSFQEVDELGHVLFEYRFTPAFRVGFFGYPESFVEAETFSLNLTAPYLDSVAELIVKRGDEIVASREVSPNPPEVRIVSPRPGEVVSGRVPLRWVGVDRDGNTLYYRVSWSFDDGQSWHLIPGSSLDMTQTSFEWDTSRFATATYRIKVRATDGVNTTEAISEPFRVIRPQYLPLVVKPAGPVPPTPTPVPIPNDGKIWGKCWEEGTGSIIRGIRMRAGSPDGNETYLESESDEDGVYKFDFLQRPRPVTEYGIWPTYHPEMRRVVPLTKERKEVREDFTFPQGTTQ